MIVFNNHYFYKLNYEIYGNKEEIVFNENFENESFKSEIEWITKPKVKIMKLIIIPKDKLKIDSLTMMLHFDFKKSQKIFVNGYQSWTDSKELNIKDKIKGISCIAKPIIRKYEIDKYGDYTFRKYSRRRGNFHSYTYTYIRENNEIQLMGSLSEENGFTIFETEVKDNVFKIHKDCKDLEIENKYLAFDIVWIEGHDDEVFDTYFELMKIRKPEDKIYTGWTSWYHYYQNINERIILDNLNALNKQIDIFQIDDGYQTAVGDWLSVDKGKFPNGMKKVANEIHSKGYKAGIWLAPFVCETNSIIFKEKKYWILRDNQNKLVTAGSNWSKFYALDIYHPEVRDYIKQVFSVVLDDWGYDMVKLDFLYAVCLLPRKDKTRGQIMIEAMKFLRECIGDKLILGCGVPLGAAFGLVDFCRIGCDISLDWNDIWYMRFINRERISTLNAIKNTIHRRHLNNRAFINDPDVFLLRDNNIKLCKTQKKTLAFINKTFGSLLFTSDDVKYYDEDKMKRFNEIMNKKKRYVKSVERYKKGLYEVRYEEGQNDYLAFVNLSKKKINYKNKMIKPYETKIYKEGM